MDGTDDKAEYKDTMDAMATMGMDNDEQSDVIQVVTGKTKIQHYSLKHDQLWITKSTNCCSLEGLLHLGNIIFGAVGGGETAEVQMDERKYKILITCCMI